MIKWRSFFLVLVSAIAFAVSLGSALYTWRMWIASQEIQAHLDSAITETMQEVRGLQGYTEQDWTEATFNMALNAQLQELEAVENRALSYLGLFESISFGLGSIGLLITFIAAIGGVSYADAINKANKATETLEQLKETVRNSSLVFYEMQLAREQMRQSGELTFAKRLYERSLQLFPDNHVLYYHIGYILIQQSQLDDAEKALKKALQYEKDFPHAQAALGYVYRRKGDDSSYYNRLVDGTRGTKENYYRLSEKWMKRALENFDYIIGDDGESWHGAFGGLYKRWALIDNDSEKWELAKYHYERAQEITPRSSYPVLNLAIINFHLNFINNALELFTTAQTNAVQKLKKESDTHFDYADLLLTQMVLSTPQYVDSIESQVVPTGDELLDNVLHNVDRYLALLPEGVNAIQNFIEDIQVIRNVSTYDTDKRNKTVISEVLGKLEEELKQRKNNDK